MKKRFVEIMVILLSISILSHTVSTEIVAESPQKGPRTDELIVNFYSDSETAFAALRAGEIDLMDWPPTRDQYEDAVADPTIQLTPRKTKKIGVKHKLHFKCIDVEDSGLKGHNCSIQQNYFLKLCNGTVFWVQSGYDLFYTGTNCNLKVYVRQWYEIWWINVTGCSSDARDIYGGPQYLGGYTNVGKPSTFNLTVDSYITGTKVMVSGLQAKPKDKEVLDWKNASVCGEIVTNATDSLVRKNHLWSTRNTAPQLVLVGYGGGSTAEWTPHTEGWVESYDSTTLKGGVPKWVTDTSGKTVKNGDHSTGEKSHNLGWEWDPKKQRGKFKYKNCSDESGMTYNFTTTRAYSRDLPGVVDMDDHGINNQYTLLNAYRADDPMAPIRIGYSSTPDMLNVLYSANYAERQVLNHIYTYLLGVQPYNMILDIPWAAQDWEIGTWFDPRDDIEKTKVTYWIRTDVGCAAPINGDFAGYFNAHDLEFTIWYIHAYDDCWLWDSVMDVHHTEIIDDQTIEVYFDDLNMWFLYAVGEKMPLLPRAQLIPLLCEQASATLAAPEDEVQFTTDSVVQVINATMDDVPLIEGVDFYIRAGYDVRCHNVFVALRPLTGIIEINYYRAVPDGASGYYLGSSLGLDWTDTMYSYGLYYPIVIDPHETRQANLNKNPYFLLETPPLGEIDWMWTWVGTTKPRSGYYQVNLYDAVTLLKAYGSRGNGQPSPNWFPGADIDITDLCHVGLYDAVTLLTKYGIKWGTPP